VDVLLTPRDIIKKSSVVDIDQWRDKATDIFFSGVEPTIRDRAATDPLIRYYLRLDTISQEVELEPYKNVVDLAEMLVRTEWERKRKRRREEKGNRICNKSRVDE
jgi:hypothetical protein